MRRGVDPSEREGPVVCTDCDGVPGEQVLVSLLEPVRVRHEPVAEAFGVGDRLLRLELKSAAVIAPEADLAEREAEDLACSHKAAGHASTVTARRSGALRAHSGGAAIEKGLRPGYGCVRLLGPGRS